LGWSGLFGRRLFHSISELAIFAKLVINLFSWHRLVAVCIFAGNLPLPKGASDSHFTLKMPKKGFSTSRGVFADLGDFHPPISVFF
jgi:hypothetical protein